MDFDVEFDDDAEKLLTDMVVSPEDSEGERSLKKEVFRVYNKRIQERQRRKTFVIQRDLLKHRVPDRSCGTPFKVGNDLASRCRPLARFQTKEEHHDLVKKLRLAKTLRAKITMLEMARGEEEEEGQG
ncbi:unnamed protein product [Discosporangium mesarthrocarpum]